MGCFHIHIQISSNVQISEKNELHIGDWDDAGAWSQNLFDGTFHQIGYYLRIPLLFHFFSSFTQYSVNGV